MVGKRPGRVGGAGMMTDMIIRRTGLTGKSPFVIVAWAVVLLLAFPAPMAPGQTMGEGDCRFPDVPATSPAHADITYACRQGWFSGYPDGSFQPDRSVPAHQLATVVGRAFAAGSTRADMATFLRGGAPGDPAAPTGFADVPATHPQSEDIAYAVERSWFQGYPDDTFRPDRTITVRQIATVLRRAFPTASTRAQLATFMRNGQQSLNAKNEPQPEPSTTKIAYEVPVYDSLGDKVARELWVASSDGSSARRLTDDVSYYHYEDYESSGDWGWSLDGERIAYEVIVRDFRGNKVGSELWAAEADGSRKRRLTDDVGYRWEWSPDGEYISYVATVQDSFGYVTGDELWVVGVDGSGARQLADEGSRWEWSPSGDWIIYEVILRDSFGYFVGDELWVVGTDGSNARRLTDDIGNNKFINGKWWSPDGERIVYEVIENSQDKETGSELWVVGVNDSDPLRLTEDFAYNWEFSPSGETIAYQSRIWEFGRWLGYGLWLADTDGSGQRLVDDDIAYHWSCPNKEMIAYGVKRRDSRRTVVNTELWVAATDGSSALRLANDISEGWGSWGWSPDGERIAYEVSVGDSSAGNRELWVVSVDGLSVRRLTDDIPEGGMWVAGWGWSTDGERIFYGVDVGDSSGGMRELWVARADGSGARRLADDIGWRWESPDGERIFYGVDVGDSSGGMRELWVARADGSGARRLTDDVALTEWGSTRWRWSPGGEMFAYGVTVRDSRGNETATELWVAGADGSGARKIADNFDNWDWQPGEG